jgi:hypothetical protein
MMKPREIDDEEYVSQYGSRETGGPVFWDKPRPEDTDGALSVVLGVLTPEEARKPVRRGGAVSASDGVRHARVGDLRAEGMQVVHTPRRENPDHTSVRRAGVWGDDATGKFNKCFGVAKWHGEPDEEGSNE